MLAHDARRMVSSATPTPGRRPARADHSTSPASRLVAPHPLLDLPIGWRLTLGFLLAALIAAAASGIPALQRAQALSRESSFYQSLLNSNTSLTTGASFLQLMNTEVHNLLVDASAPAPSSETLATEEAATTGLAGRYSTILNTYVHGGLLDQHVSQTDLLNEAGHGVEVSEQSTLASSALRTWQFYVVTQAAVVNDVAIGDLASAQALEREQGEPTNADALSAVRALIQFDGRIAASIQDAAQVEQANQILTASLAAVLAFLAIGAVGWIISNTLVRRLSALRRVTRLVEAGQVEERVVVAGRDEIAAVSASVNGMLDTIVGLLDVTRRQRDALTDAADRLFADMRLAGSGDLRVNAPIGSDPIGMLANAFNFTIGRFRRFLLRTQSTLDQLEVVGRRELERTAMFLSATEQHIRGGGGAPSQPGDPAHIFYAEASLAHADGAPDVFDRVVRAREMVREVGRLGMSAQARSVVELSEQAYVSAGRVYSLLASPGRQALYNAGDATTHAAFEELRSLGTLLQRVASAAYGIHEQSGARLAELDRALESIPVSRTALPLEHVTPSMPAVPSSQMLDVARLAHGLARDVSAMARQMLGVTHELRTGLVPFRLEAAERGGTMPYAPGAAQGDPAMPDAFYHQPGRVNAGSY